MAVLRRTRNIGVFADLVIADIGPIVRTSAPGNKTEEQLQRIQVRWAPQQDVVEGRDFVPCVHAFARHHRPAADRAVIYELVRAPGCIRLARDDSEFGENSPRNH